MVAACDGKRCKNEKVGRGAKGFYYRLKRADVINKKFEGVSMTIRKELLEILACPKCKGDVKLDELRNGLICEKCSLRYRIKDNIPVMLIGEAEGI